MNKIDLVFENISYIFPMIFVEETKDKPFLFGTGTDQQEITIKDFFISKFTVTQILYEHIMGTNPSNNKGKTIPVECLSYNDIVKENGFFAKINSGNLKNEISNQFETGSLVQFRLPSEAEWEYAAKGGKHWTDNFMYSGSNEIDEVAWYEDNTLGESMPVGMKKPNQLGIYDMSGNIWEWCEDYYHAGTHKIPKDGSPCLEESPERVLRGGCFSNWACIAQQQSAIRLNLGSKIPVSVFGWYCPCGELRGTKQSNLCLDFQQLNKL